LAHKEDHEGEDDLVIDGVEAYVRFLNSIKQEIPESNREQLPATIKEIISQSWDGLHKFLLNQAKNKKEKAILPESAVMMLRTTRTAEKDKNKATPKKPQDADFKKKTSLAETSSSKK